MDIKIGDTVKIQAFCAEIEDNEYRNVTLRESSFDRLIDVLIDFADDWDYTISPMEFTPSERVMLLYEDGWKLKFNSEKDFLEYVLNDLSEDDMSVYREQKYNKFIRYYDTGVIEGKLIGKVE